MINRKLKQVRGQSTVEYIILATGVIAALVFFLLRPESPFKSKLNQTLGTVTGEVTTLGDRLQTSHQ